MGLGAILNKMPKKKKKPQLPHFILNVQNIASSISPEIETHDAHESFSISISTSQF
jgi:hypothetical protein